MMFEESELGASDDIIGDDDNNEVDDDGPSG